MSASTSDFAAALFARGTHDPGSLAFASAGERLTYGELLVEAVRLAAGLGERGVAPGARVALLLPAGLAFVRGFAAVSLAGAVPFAINPEIAPQLAIARAARGRPALALTTRALLDRWKAFESEFPVVALESTPGIVRESPAPLAVDPEDPAILQMTSGSTGEPRLAILSHRALAAWRHQAAGPFLAGPGDVLVGWVPPWHVMGLVRYVLLPVVCGAPAHLVPPAVHSLGSWLETAARVRATFTSAPDFALRAAVRVFAGPPPDLGALRCLITGGEPVRQSSIVEFEERFDLRGIVRPAYGLSEATLAVACARPGEALAVDPSGHVSCGRPLPGVELRIADERGLALPPGESGEIQVRSESLFSGYFGEPPETAAPGIGGWLATGDWGRLGAEGELYVFGRRRNLLKHGGATYAPRELEEAAASVDGVLEAAAVSLARSDRSEPVAVLVVERSRRAGFDPADLARSVTSAVRRGVGILPGEIIVVEPGTLSRTENGKLRHAEVRMALVMRRLPPGSVLFGQVDGWSE